MTVLRALLVFNAIVLWTGVPHAQERKEVISREQLQEMFDSMTQKSGWDMSKDMVWGYFFTDALRPPLERAAQLLASQGYVVVDIYLADKESDRDPDLWWLHVEKVETHTVASLDARNHLLYQFADEQGLDTYDGMDVGPVRPRN
jgi:hypothetical protein